MFFTKSYKLTPYKVQIKFQLLQPFTYISEDQKLYNNNTNRHLFLFLSSLCNVMVKPCTKNRGKIIKIKPLFNLCMIFVCILLCLSPKQIKKCYNKYHPRAIFKTTFNLRLSLYFSIRSHKGLICVMYYIFCQVYFYYD